MKLLLLVLSAAVLTGLAVYAAFTACGAFQVTAAANVIIAVDTLVWLFACLCIGTAAVTLLLRLALVRSDQRSARAIEERLARLEQRAPSLS